MLTLVLYLLVIYLDLDVIFNLNAWIFTLLCWIQYGRGRWELHFIDVYGDIVFVQVHQQSSPGNSSFAFLWSLDCTFTDRPVPGERGEFVPFFYQYKLIWYK